MNIDTIIEKAREDSVRQKEREEEANRRLTYHEATDKIDYWRRHYCKGTQPKNYIRITRTIPNGFADRPFFWVLYLQVWVRGELHLQSPIGNDTFYTLSTLDGWVKSDRGTHEFYVWRHPKHR